MRDFGSQSQPGPQGVSPRSERGSLRDARPLRRRPRRGEHREDGSRGRPGEPCEPVPALPSGNGPSGSGAGGGPAYTPRGDQAMGQAAIAADLRQAAGRRRSIRCRRRSAARSRAVPLHEDEGGPTRGLGPERPRVRGRRRTPGISCRSATPSARYALVPTLKEVWTAPDGTTRERETLGRVELPLGRRPRALGSRGLTASLRLRPQRARCGTRRLRAPGEGFRVQGLSRPP